MAVVDKAPLTLAMREQVLVELAQWLGRVMQYSPDHPTCREMADKAFRTLTRALESEPLIAYGILKGAVLIGDVESKHPVLRTRIAPHLHDRGVLVLRFMQGVTAEDVNAFLDLIRLPVQTVFERGGLVRMVLERGITRVQLEELAHEITEEERESSKRRRRLGTLFTDNLRNLQAHRGVDAGIGKHVFELLQHPTVAISVLEDQGAGIADAAAGMALMVRQEEEATDRALGLKLRGIFASLAPASRDRLLLGFPHLVDEFRDALAWVMRGYDEAELARFIFPSFREHAHELDVVLYALDALIPHDGTRLSTLRRVGLLLHDLPLDDRAADTMLSQIGRSVDDYESYRKERLCLVDPALHALTMRTFAQLRAQGNEPYAAPELPPLDEGTLMTEVVAMAARTKQFERLCRRLPAVAGRLAGEGRRASLVGMVRGLAQVERPEVRELALRTTGTVARTCAADVMIELDRTNTGAPSPELIATVRLLVASNPGACLDHLERCDNPGMRKLLLELLPNLGAKLLPMVRTKLTADAGPAVLAALTLLLPVGGTPGDLANVARSSDPRVRLEVARLLRTMPPDEPGMDIIVRYLRDPSEDVRQCVRMLVRGELLSPAAIMGIDSLLTDPAQPEDLHRRLVRALGMSAHDSAAKLLYDLMQPVGIIESKTAGAIRDLAAAALSKCPAPGATKLFQDGLASSVWRVRKACERAASEGA